MPARTPSVHPRRWLEPPLKVSLEPAAQRVALPQATAAAGEVRLAELRVLGRARESAAARSCRPRRRGRSVPRCLSHGSRRLRSSGHRWTLSGHRWTLSGHRWVVS